MVRTCPGRRPARRALRFHSVAVPRASPGVASSTRATENPLSDRMMTASAPTPVQFGTE
jgi:hypothetical protein